MKKEIFLFSNTFKLDSPLLALMFIINYLYFLVLIQQYDLMYVVN